jgi:hypothetical protein
MLPVDRERGDEPADAGADDRHFHARNLLGPIIWHYI